MRDTHKAIEAVWKIGSARLIAGIARVTRDIGIAEELAQDALVAALERWPEDGIPENPAAWLMTAAKRRAIDSLRRGRMLELKHGEITRELEFQQQRLGEAMDQALDRVIDDDVLRLIFTACHPVLAVEGRIALTLRVACGLTTTEIARSFLVPEKTLGQRIFRPRRHCPRPSLQTSDFESAETWLKAWRKPICYDEVKYEGNFASRWGNLSGEEMTRRFWLGVIAGCYVTHGETYLDPDTAFDEKASPTIPWSHGGKLRGTSPARIAFLRKLVEETAAFSGKDAKRTGLEAQPAGYYLNASSLDEAGKDAKAILYYFDYHQPIFYEFPLPAHNFTAEMIDPWNMTITTLPGTVSGKSKIRLSGRPYQAIRFRRMR